LWPASQRSNRQRYSSAAGRVPHETMCPCMWAGPAMAGGRGRRHGERDLVEAQAAQQVRRLPGGGDNNPRDRAALATWPGKVESNRVRSGITVRTAQ
jgi:hypothetical protein